MTSQHVADNGEHIEKLDRRLRELKDSFAVLGRTGDIDEMIRIIHQPGWTTPVELVLVNTLLDAVESAALDAAHRRAGLQDGVLRVLGETMS